MPETRFASCSCGAIGAHGQPLRVGLCHCTTCRKESGAQFITPTRKLRRRTTALRKPTAISE